MLDEKTDTALVYTEKDLPTSYWTKKLTHYTLFV